jgi:hypothetical protein
MNCHETNYASGQQSTSVKEGMPHFEVVVEEVAVDDGLHHTARPHCKHGTNSSSTCMS